MTYRSSPSVAPMTDNAQLPPIDYGLQGFTNLFNNTRNFAAVFNFGPAIQPPTIRRGYGIERT